MNIRICGRDLFQNLESASELHKDMALIEIEKDMPSGQFSEGVILDAFYFAVKHLDACAKRCGVAIKNGCFAFRKMDFDRDSGLYIAKKDRSEVLQCLEWLDMKDDLLAKFVRSIESGMPSVSTQEIT